MKMTEWEPSLAVPVSPKRDHIRGPQKAAVTLVEYGDYQCPYCAAAHGIVAEVQQRMGDGLQFVFRHFPLVTVHPMAEPAAEAAEAAGAQGRFWDMNDMLYDNQGQLAPSSLIAFAAAIGLDLERFTDELAQHAHLPKVRDDLLSGVRSGVRGTPTFFINGRRYDGPWDLANLLGSLQAAAAGRHAA
jgi:protein-disulfide isomerase